MKYTRTMIPKHIRDEVRQKFGGCCAYCGESLKKVFHVDHVIPVSSGGLDDLLNYFPACVDCNAFKSDWSLERFRQELENQTFLHVRFTLAKKFNTITVHPTRIVFYFEKCGHTFDEKVVLEMMAKSPRVGLQEV